MALDKEFPALSAKTGLGRIEEALQHRKGADTAAFMPYHPMGFPTRAESLQLVQAMALAGADIFEIGFPFSDPLADGPTIQGATQKALEGGTTTRDCLQMGAELRSAGVTQPFCAMAYFNPIYNYGLEAFVQDAQRSGFDGLLVPDLPPEEAGDLAGLCREAQLALPCFVAPTSSPERMQLAAKHSTGFVYLVSVSGITGARSSVAAYLNDLVGRFRAYTDTPICIGFGISTGPQASAIARIAEGVIVGSALVNAAGQSDCLTAVSELAEELAAGAHGEHLPAHA